MQVTGQQRLLPLFYHPKKENLMFEDFEQRFGPKSIDDIVFAAQSARELIEDLVKALVEVFNTN